MPSAIVRFRPTGPWRFGPDSGTRDRVDLIFHSDTLYAAVTSAMLRLNLLDEWLDATARHRNGEPQVRFSSLFPFQRDILFVTPPRNLWPPPASSKIRFKSARFVPISVVKALVAEQAIDENRWVIDGESQCMIPSGEGPFRIGLRSAAAVDRLNPAAYDPHITACIEFGRDAGLWTMVVFANEEAQGRWKHRVRGALRLLADTGVGGERSRGWGRSSEPEWQKAPEWWAAPETDKGYWMLSVYAPTESDKVDWKTGNYSTLTRTGRIESATQWGGLKPPAVMISEGSVLVAPYAPRGEARDVAPEEFTHPVYRAGFGVSIPIPWKAPGTAAPVFSSQKPVETAAKPVTAAPEAPPIEAAPAPPESAPAEAAPEQVPAEAEPPQPELAPEAEPQSVEPEQPKSAAPTETAPQQVPVEAESPQPEPAAAAEPESGEPEQPESAAPVETAPQQVPAESESPQPEPAAAAESESVEPELPESAASVETAPQQAPAEAEQPQQPLEPTPEESETKPESPANTPEPPSGEDHGGEQ